MSRKVSRQKSVKTAELGKPIQVRPKVQDREALEEYAERTHRSLAATVLHLALTQLAQQQNREAA